MKIPTIDDFKVGDYIYLGVSHVVEGEPISREVIDVNYKYNKVVLKIDEYHFDAMAPEQIFDCTHYNYRPSY